MFFNLYVLFSILALIYYGFLIVRIDWVSNKIPNKIILKIIKVGLFLHLFLFMLNLLDGLGFSMDFFSPPNKTFFLSILINSTASLTVAYVLWKFRVWAAGDAKMFFAFSFIFPLTFYKFVEIPFFLSFTILINIFLIGGLYFFIKSFIYFQKTLFFWLLRPNEVYKFILANLKNNKKSFILQPLNFFFIFYIFFRINNHIKDFLFKYFEMMNIPSLSNYLLPIILLVLFPKFKKMIRTKYTLPIFFIIVIAVDVYTVNSSAQFQAIIYRTVKNIFIFTFVLGTLDYVFSYYIKNKDTKTVRADSLKEGMILSDESLVYLQKKDFFERIETIYPEGLMEEQIKIIKKELQGYKLTVYEPRSFANWIYIGFIFTLIFGQSIPTLISRYL